MARQLISIVLTLALFHLLSAAPSVQFVEKSLILDIGTRDAGEIREWVVETQSDRILLLKIQNPESGELLDPEVIKSILMITENRDDGVFTLFPESEPTTTITPIYSTRNSVLIRVNNDLINQFQLKIDKAVICPQSLEPSSVCARVVDDLSCYCASFIARQWPDGRNFCNNNGFKIIALESEEEDKAIYSYFGGEQGFWIGASDSGQEGNFVWEATGNLLSSGYTNWADGEPNNGDGAEDCAHYGWTSPGKWNDCFCSGVVITRCLTGFPDNQKMGTLCELQP